MPACVWGECADYLSQPLVNWSDWLCKHEGQVRLAEVTSPTYSVVQYHRAGGSWFAKQVFFN